MKAVIFWKTGDRQLVERIRQHAGVPRYTTLNGLSPWEGDEKMFAWLKECAKMGLIRIWQCEWTHNGHTYSFDKSS